MHPGDPGRARRRTQPDERHPPDVLAQADLPSDPGVQRGDREAGDGGRHDQVDVRGGQVGRLERVDQRPRAELDGVLDEEVVGVAEVAELGVLLQRQHGVPPLDAGVAVEAAQQRLVDAPLGDDLAERLGDLLLRVGVRRQRAARGQDPHGSLRGLGASERGSSGSSRHQERRGAWRRRGRCRPRPGRARGRGPRPAPRGRGPRRPRSRRRAKKRGRGGGEGRGDAQQGRTTPSPWSGRTADAARRHEVAAGQGGDRSDPARRDEPVGQAADTGGGVVVEAGSTLRRWKAPTTSRRTADRPPPAAAGGRPARATRRRSALAERHGVRAVATLT